MPATCFECGQLGHVKSECPNLAYVDGTGGSWCGSCDERTRLVDLGDSMKRCSECHPLRREMLPQHHWCPACHEVIYEWDHAPCDKHHEVGKQREHVDLERRAKLRDEESSRVKALAQVAESRRERAVIDG